MKILVVGSGGREHALVWKLAQSTGAPALYAAPGNPGMSEYARCVNIKADDLTGIGKFAVGENMDLVVVGPEIPLCMGITDLLEEAGIAVFGVTGWGKDFDQACARAYAAAGKISFTNAFHRRDIGQGALKYLKGNRMSTGERIWRKLLLYTAVIRTAR